LKTFVQSLVCPLLFCLSAFAANRDALIFTHYDLTATVTPSQMEFDVRGSVTLRNDSESPQKYAVMQISSTLKWRTITINSEPVEYLAQPYTTDIDHTGAVSEITITLPKPLDPKQSVTIALEYGGTIPADSLRLTRIGTPTEDALRSDWDQVSPTFTGVRGLGFVTWYPVSTDAASLSDGNAVFETIADWRRKQTGASMHINLCIAARESAIQVILANGAESKSDKTPPDTTCKSYDYTLAPLLVPAFVIGPLEPLERPAETVYHVKGHGTAAQDYAAEFERLAPLAAQWLGAPHEHAVFVELTGRAAAPYETGALMFAPLGQGNRLTTDIAASYELAQVSKRSFRPWIDYGLAHFLQLLTVEQETGRAGALKYLEQYAGPLSAADKTPTGDDVKLRSLINTDDELFYRAKSLFVFSMLRDIVGDHALTAAITSYQSADDHDASYFQKLVETKSKKDLEWFFDDWVYRDRGLPDFKIVSAYPRQILGGQFLTTITVENSGTAAAEVPVSIVVRGGERSARVLVKAGEKASARINSTVLPTQVIVNDGSVPESNLTNNTYDIPANSAPAPPPSPEPPPPPPPSTL
jgi:hypothetical protein